MRRRIRHWWIKLGCDLRGETVEAYCMRRFEAATDQVNRALAGEFGPAVAGAMLAVQDLNAALRKIKAAGGKDAGLLSDPGMNHPEEGTR